MVKEINLYAKVKTSVNLQRDIIDKCSLISIGKDLIVTQLTEKIKKESEMTQESELNIIGSSNRNETIEDLISMAIGGSSTSLYRINGTDYTPKYLIDFAKLSIALLIINHAKFDNIDLIEVSNVDEIEKLGNTKEGLKDYIEKKGVENIIKNNVDEYLAGEGIGIIEDIIANLKGTIKSKNDIEAFENLGGFDLIREILYERANEEIKSLANNVDDAVEVIIDKYNFDII